VAFIWAIQVKAHTPPPRPRISSLGEPNLLPPGPSGMKAPGTVASAGSRYHAELHALDVRGLQPFRAGFHFKADAGAFF
jgi:hypothetical protein